MKGFSIKAIFLFLFVLPAFALFAQTNPVPFNLLSGDFTFNGYTDSTLTVYPASMQGWKGITPIIAASASAPSNLQATGDEPLKKYFVRANDGFDGAFNWGSQGLSIENFGTPTALAFALAINTMNVKDILLKWTARQISDASSTEIFKGGMILQYRIGSSGSWSTVDTNRYLSPNAPGGTPVFKKFTFKLPVALEEKPQVQFRFLYFQETEDNGVGSNAVSADDISVIAGTRLQAPVADFTTDANQLVVNFTDASSNAPASWKWDFGDGQTDLTQNPSHTYSTGGTYDVKLLASNAAGTDSIIKTISVSGGNAPTAAFGFVASDLNVQFSDSSLNNPTSWLWNFGDGQTDGVQDPAHTYAAGGTYDVKLVVNNGSGTDSITKSVTVFPMGISGNRLFELHVYPNPAIDILNITSSAPISDGLFTITNTLGQLVHSSIFNERTKIDISAIPNGFYIAGLQYGNNRSVVRIAICR